ncbi:hypothetical protein MW887_001035 [Aspergillus wentii]|nr:hypothetical protein MW887_001035 [Aspergillus wentii]
MSHVPVDVRRDNNEPVVTADWLEKIVMGDRIPTAVPAMLREGLNASRENNPDYTGVAGSLSISFTASSENPATLQLISFLPKQSETMALFQYYTSYIDYLYHIIIPDHVEEQIYAIYDSIDKNQPVNLNHLALVFAISASSLFLQLSVESSAYAEMCSREFTFLTGAALIQGNYTAYPTVEGLQATMVVAHNISNLHSHPSVNALFSHTTIIGQAKNLMLHCIDSPKYSEERKAKGADVMEVELKRRLWWDLVSYDWLLGFLSGPQEWTYSIYMDHMNVQQPANIDDEPITNADNYSSPTSTPTSMSYSLQRLKLAFVCRDIVDTTAHEHLHNLEINYDKILTLDRKLHQAYSELPDFFRLDPVSRRRFSALYHARPTIAWQRCLLQQGYHSRFCRLHRQYLIRGARDPTYSYSHVICLQSARKVLEIKRIMDEDEPRFAPPSAVVWSVMHHVFMAAVILLMDVCFNWDDILADKRKEEVLDACRMLSNAQQSSSIVREGIDAMMGVLQKHWKNGKPLSTQDSSTVNPVLVQSDPVAQVYTPVSAVEKDSSMEQAHNVISDETGERHLEDIWTELLDSGGSLDYETPDWTGLLAELTNTTLPCS